MEHNRAPISIREGKVFINGVECLDGVKAEIKYTPDVWEGRQLGDRSSSSRWLGYSVKGTITRRRSTPFLEDVIKEYQRTGQTPELTIQGIMDDTGSDYYRETGKNITCTAVGCVLTGDFSLINLDSGGDVLDDAIGFNAKDVIF